jgi:hypothetical protein
VRLQPLRKLALARAGHRRGAVGDSIRRLRVRLHGECSVDGLHLHRLHRGGCSLDTRLLCSHLNHSLTPPAERPCLPPLLAPPPAPRLSQLASLTPASVCCRRCRPCSRPSARLMCSPRRRSCMSGSRQRSRFKRGRRRRRRRCSSGCPQRWPRRCASRPSGLGFGLPAVRGERQSVAAPQAARGWAHPPCRHFKTQSCFCLGSAFEVAAFQTAQLSPAEATLPRPSASTVWSRRCTAMQKLRIVRLGFGTS